ncbi:MAG TPA: hypothetical protein VGL66_13300 [Caulobacteraceae bacterium]|jgi:hypothetical protein
MRPGTARPLTSGERNLARETFGDALDLDPVRILACPPGWNRAFVAGRWFGRDWILYPAKDALTDYASAPLNTQATLIHELVHVHQAQAGVNLLTAKLRAGDSRAAYAYHPGGERPWSALNIEQQATLVEHLFLARRGMATPWPVAVLEKICPFNGLPPGPWSR